jgi:serine/threonine-protein kinase
LTGQVIDGRYRVIEPLGAGAMGSVFRGERINLGRMVAIKVLNEAVPDDAARRRFEREARAMAKLEHPNCGGVLDVGIHDGNPYVVMEFVSGQNVKEVLKAGPIPVERAVEIVRQVLSGLSHAHEHGITHRDIKPANIVLSQKSGVGDLVKILDFGLARFQQDTTNLTGGLVLGTPSYMSPEQIRGGQFDHRVDLYACGVMLFELLTGAKPFHADEPLAVCMQHISAPPPRLADKAPGRSFGALEDVVARALEKDPDRRFASAEEFSRALVEASKNVAATALPATPPPALPATPPPALPATPPRASSPTPVATSETLAAESLPVAPVASTPSRHRTSKALWVGVVAAACVVGAVGIWVATRSDSRPEPVAAPAPVATPEPVAKPEPVEAGEDPVAELLERAKAMAASGRREPAIELLTKARKTYPQDARLPYEASKLYLGKMWWADGMKQARSAIALDPSYRNDAELIKLVLTGFNTTASYDWALAKFLREDIGPAAKPFMEQTAQSHPNKIVRTRAAAELKRYD